MATTSTVSLRQNGSAIEIQVPCPYTVKIYNKGMGVVDLVDWC